jgi:hypothetical protein
MVITPLSTAGSCFANGAHLHVANYRKRSVRDPPDFLETPGSKDNRHPNSDTKAWASRKISTPGADMKAQSE